MTTQINSNYLEKYAKDYAEIVCDRFYQNRQFITGQDIVGLTASVQVNFFVIRRLFELWQQELQKLKSNPYFDYRDVAVHEALTQFMNVLSRRIKVERAHLQPLVEFAVQKSIELATNPMTFYQAEIDQAPSQKINEYLAENKRYYKWHPQVITFLIDKAGFGQDPLAYKKAIAANYQAIKEQLESVNLLLATLGEIKAFDLDAYIENAPETEAPKPIVEEEKQDSFFDQIESEPSSSEPEEEKVPETTIEPESPKAPPVTPSYSAGKLDPNQIKSRFAAESYKGMKGLIGELSESLAINQRFMFRKELFEGNDDLLTHALKSLDACKSFDEAVEVINVRYLTELGWDESSEPVEEFLHVVYRRFSD
ncbi:hypothetical protein E4S40_15855 [Algoriphagus kandeliae]|uniref:Uncharacterized protein n=1 Tax=Algoriphagus kandeliae TaxID=2562278 RepID=A0A4Y9QNA3_9BACT|nr:hypothetical protein [Algoriphagus kandeliae]TFV93717.1 hypothetical protein E4S40_15855 [Algoriphagus kandeliae]